MTERDNWVARVGDVWAQEWRRTDRMFADLARSLDAAILAVAPAQGRAVDIGCGAGATSTALAAARPGLSVLGVDLSAALVAVAKAERGPLPNLDFVAGDVMTAVADAAPVDLFVSRHGVMFFDDPVAGFAALRHAAAPNAALVFSCFAGRSDNEWVGIVDATIGGPPASNGAYAPGPFAFADPALVADTLARAGWRNAAPQSVDYRYCAGEGVDDDAALDDAASLFTRIGPAAPWLAGLAEDERAALRIRLREALAPYCRGGRVVLGARAWIWTARAWESS
jgi:SAM-dependent methyltransferase